MPTYSYFCKRGHTFDLMRSVATRNDPLTCEAAERLKSGFMCTAPAVRIEIPPGKPPAFVTRPGVGDRSPFSRDREGK